MIQTTFKNNLKIKEKEPKSEGPPPPYGKFPNFFCFFIEPFPFSDSFKVLFDVFLEYGKLMVTQKILALSPKTNYTPFCSWL